MTLCSEHEVVTGTLKVGGGIPMRSELELLVVGTASFASTALVMPALTVSKSFVHLSSALNPSSHCTALFYALYVSVTCQTLPTTCGEKEII